MGISFHLILDTLDPDWYRVLILTKEGTALLLYNGKFGFTLPVSPNSFASVNTERPPEMWPVVRKLLCQASRACTRYAGIDLSA